MKIKNYVVALTFLVSIFSLSAQKVVTQEVFTNFGSKQGNAYKANISYQEMDDVDDALDDFFKKYDAKYKSKKGMAKVENVTILEIENTPINVYTKLEKTGDKQSSLTMGFEGLGGFLSTSENAEVAAKAQKVLYDFAYNQTKKGLTMSIEKETEENEDLLKDKEKLVKDKEKLTEDIEEAKKVIEESSKELEKVGSELEKQNTKLEESTNRLNVLKTKMSEI